MTPGAGRVGQAIADAGGALLLIGVLTVAWTAVESNALLVDRDLDARVATLLDDYAAPSGSSVARPEVLVGARQGPGIAASNCDRWQISIHAGMAAQLSDPALDDLLAHELAHLLVCAETGRSTGHGPDWWARYHALINLT